MIVALDLVGATEPHSTSHRRGRGYKRQKRTLKHTMA
jgi:hypothetical protein